jgi:hypothetical protein
MLVAGPTAPAMRVSMDALCNKNRQRKSSGEKQDMLYDGLVARAKTRTEDPIPCNAAQFPISCNL